ncbi:hypothetical protein Scep_009296 [Stephania cephalantha]|uniref:Uncharacterized protein n=1 Tax=Stephania cephalantha TaxID=152367 RepID=A0AAP0PG46_9MAGN
MSVLRGKGVEHDVSEARAEERVAEAGHQRGGVVGVLCLLERALARVVLAGGAVVG